VPWWNETLKVLAANATDAHRPLGPDHQLPSALSHVESRTVANDYTFRYAGKLYPIASGNIRQGLGGGTVRVEPRLDGSLTVRFGNASLQVSPMSGAPESRTCESGQGNVVFADYRGATHGSLASQQPESVSPHD
jgi:hypothetical protein